MLWLLKNDWDGLAGGNEFIPPFLKTASFVGLLPPIGFPFASPPSMLSILLADSLCKALYLLMTEAGSGLG